MSEAGYFSEDNSTELVAERLLRAPPTPLSRALSTVVDHLHAAIKETRPSPEEWQQVIAFLTEVGHAADGRRQEWVLLADLLGASALVEDINARRPKGATPNTVRGPFYRTDAPHLPLGANISLDGVGEPLAVSCLVKDLDGAPVAGARVETWQANAQGAYENQRPDLQPEFNLRAIFTTGDDGRIHYTTVRPVGYKVPDDGPVGQLLSQLGYPMRRPAHLHFQIRAKGYQKLTTHVYANDDPDLREDAIFGVKRELLGVFSRAGGTEVRPEWSLDFTFVLCAERANGAGKR